MEDSKAEDLTKNAWKSSARPNHDFDRPLFPNSLYKRSATHSSLSRVTPVMSQGQGVSP